MLPPTTPDIVTDYPFARCSRLPENGQIDYSATLPQKYSQNASHHRYLDSIGSNQDGTGGGTRTHTPFYGPRILSPVCLPFHHTGKLFPVSPDQPASPDPFGEAQFLRVSASTNPECDTPHGRSRFADRSPVTVRLACPSRDAMNLATP